MIECGGEAMKNIFIIATLIIVVSILNSMAYSASVWTSYLPASQASTVYDVALQGGYLWCATANGPVRWDTLDMTYKTFPDAPEKNTVSVLSDNKGNVWFGSGIKLMKYDGTSWSIQYISNYTIYYLRNLDKDIEGNLYLGYIANEGNVMGILQILL